MADRLHNMQTIQFLPQAKQLRKARETLDTFLPAAQQLSLHTVRSELQKLAGATLIRNRPPRPSRRRGIVALDIEGSTSRPDPVKAELRTMLYELFDAALRSAGIPARRRDRFIDRGDGLLALTDPTDQAALLHRAVPVFAQLLTGYNAGLPDPGGQRQLRVRAVMHTGDVHDDDNGCYGEALDIAFRLLDAPASSRRSKRRRARSCSSSPATSTTRSCARVPAESATPPSAASSPRRPPATSTMDGSIFP
jgi:hypothetical protein